MLELTEGIRASLERSLALGEDAEGREVFVGLSRIKSERYHLLSDPGREWSLKEHLEFLCLDTKHAEAHASLNPVDPQSSRGIFNYVTLHE